MCCRGAGRGGHTECKHWFLRITNETSLASDPERPEVFFSGNLHGNEEVGPMTLIYMVGQVGVGGGDASSVWPADVARMTSPCRRNFC